MLSGGRLTEILFSPRVAPEVVWRATIFTIATGVLSDVKSCSVRCSGGGKLRKQWSPRQRKRL